MADKLVIMSSEELNHAKYLCDGVDAIIAKMEEDEVEGIKLFFDFWQNIKIDIIKQKTCILKLHDEYKGVK